MNREKIEDALFKMGVPVGNKGFKYMADTIEIFEEKGTNISITEELYPTIAEKNNTTVSRVERAIRYALRITREKGNKEEINKYIGFINCSNSPSLKMLYKQLKRESEGCLETKEMVIDVAELRKIIREEIEIFFEKMNGDKI